MASIVFSALYTYMQKHANLASRPCRFIYIRISLALRTILLDEAKQQSYAILQFRNHGECDCSYYSLKTDYLHQYALAMMDQLCMIPILAVQLL